MPLVMTYPILESLYNALTDPHFFDEKKSGETPIEKRDRLRSEAAQLRQQLASASGLSTQKREKLETDLERATRALSRLEKLDERSSSPPKKFSLPKDKLDCLKWLLVREDLLYCQLLKVNPECIPVIQSLLDEHFQSLVEMDSLKISDRGANTIVDNYTLGLIQSSHSARTPRIYFYCRLIHELYPEDDEVLMARRAHAEDRNQLFTLSVYKIANFLELAFETEKDALDYLKTVSYTSKESVERALDFRTIELGNLSTEQQYFWYFVNKTLGRIGLFFYSRADELKDLDGFKQLVKDYKTLSTEDLRNKLDQFCEEIIYPRASEHREMATFCRENTIPGCAFADALDCMHKGFGFSGYDDIKTSDDLPDINQLFTDQKGRKYSLEKLSAGDFRGFFLGYQTGCCQNIDGESSRCVIDGMTKPSAGFYVIKDEKGKIVAQSYAWLGIDKDDNRCLVLDSFEALPGSEGTCIPAIQVLREKLSTEIPPMILYIGTGGKTPAMAAEELDAPKPLDPKLFLYGDSHKVVRVTEDLKTCEDSDLANNGIFQGNHQAFQKLHKRLQNYRILELLNADVSYLDRSTLKFLIDGGLIFDQVKNLTKEKLLMFLRGEAVADLIMNEAYSEEAFKEKLISLLAGIENKSTEPLRFSTHQGPDAQLQLPTPIIHDEASNDKQKPKG